MEEINNLKENFFDLTKNAKVFKETSEILSDELLKTKTFYEEKLSLIEKEKQEALKSLKEKLNTYEEKLSKNESELKQILKENKTLKENYNELEKELKLERNLKNSLKEDYEKKIEEITEDKIKFLEKVQLLKREKEKLSESLNESLQEKEEIIEKLNNSKKENKKLVKSLQEKEEIIEKLNNSKDKLSKIIEDLKQEKNTIIESKNDKNSEKLKEEIKQIKIKYFQEKYKIDSGIIKSLFEKYNNDTLIEKEIKALKKSQINSKILVGEGFDFKITEEKRENSKISKLKNLIN